VFINFPRKWFRSWDNVNKYCRDGQANWQCNTPQAHLLLYTYVYRHTVRIWNTISFPRQQQSCERFSVLTFKHTFPDFFFPFVWPCIITNFFAIKSTRCTNFTNLFCHEILHVSDSSSVHHQEFIHCTLSNGICYTGL